MTGPAADLMPISAHEAVFQARWRVATAPTVALPATLPAARPGRVLLVLLITPLLERRLHRGID